MRQLLSGHAEALIADFSDERSAPHLAGGINMARYASRGRINKHHTDAVCCRWPLTLSALNPPSRRRSWGLRDIMASLRVTHDRASTPAALMISYGIFPSCMYIVAASNES